MATFERIAAASGNCKIEHAPCTFTFAECSDTFQQLLPDAHSCRHLFCPGIALRHSWASPCPSDLAFASYTAVVAARCVTRSFPASLAWLAFQFVSGVTLFIFPAPALLRLASTASTSTYVQLLLQLSHVSIGAAHNLLSHWQTRL